MCIQAKIVQNAESFSRSKKVQRAKRHELGGLEPGGLRAERPERRRHARASVGQISDTLRKGDKSPPTYLSFVRLILPSSPPHHSSRLARRAASIHPTLHKLSTPISRGPLRPSEPPHRRALATPCTTPSQPINQLQQWPALARSSRNWRRLTRPAFTARRRSCRTTTSSRCPSQTASGSESARLHLYFADCTDAD